MQHTPGFGILCVTFFSQLADDTDFMDCDQEGPAAVVSLVESAFEDDDSVPCNFMSSFIWQPAAATAAAGKSSHPCRSGSNDVIARHSP